MLLLGCRMFLNLTGAEQMIRNLLLAILSLQMVIPPQVLAGPIDPKHPYSTAQQGDNLGPSMESALDQGDARLMHDILDFSDKIEHRQVTAADIEDVWGLRGWRYDYFDRDGHLKLQLSGDDYAAKRPRNKVTTIKIRFDALTSELIFDGFRGEDSQGNHGQLVARATSSTFKNDPVVEIIQDKDIYVLLTKSGRMHAIDRVKMTENFMESQVIPVFKGFWEPSQPMNIDPILANLEFMTPGTRPFSESMVTEKTEFPNYGTGQRQYKAGDIYFLYDQKVIVVKSRDEVLRFVAAGLGEIYKRAKAASADFEVLTKRLKISEHEALGLDPIKAESETRFDRILDLVAETGMAEHDLFTKQMSSDVRTALLATKTNTQEQFFQRALQISKNSHPERYRGAQRHEFNDAEWIQDFKAIQERAIAEEGESASLQKTFSHRWVDLLAPEGKKALSAAEELRVAREAKADSQFQWAVFYTIGGIFAFAGTYMMADLQSYHLYYLDKAYQALPPVLRTEWYIFPLFVSVATGLAIIPAITGSSAQFGRYIMAQAEKVKDSTTRKAIYIKDLANKYGSRLTTDTRIITGGWRLFATLIYPFWKLTIVDILSQKSYYSAKESGLNPSMRVSKDSLLGRKFGLEADQRLGLNKPGAVDLVANTPKLLTEATLDVLNGNVSEGKAQKTLKSMADRAKQKTELNLKMQSIIGQQMKHNESRAVFYGVIPVAEKYGIEPAILLQAMSMGEVDSQTLKKLVENPEIKNELILVVDGIRDQLNRLTMTEFTRDLSNDASNKQSIKEIEELHKMAEETARDLSLRIQIEVSQQTTLSRSFALLNLKLKQAGRTVNNFLVNFAMDDIVALKTRYANEEDAKIVIQQWKPDWILATGLYAVWGERANLSHVENLMAQPQLFSHDSTLFTNNKHWIDNLDQTYVYLIYSAALQMMLGRKKVPKPDSTYAPLADQAYPNAYRQQPIFQSAKDWALAAFNPLRGDVGGYTNKKFFRRFPNIQSYFYVQYMFRILVAKQTAMDAFLGLSLTIMASQWWYAWPWPFIICGLMFSDYRLVVNINELSGLKEKLLKASRSNSPEEVNVLMESAMSKIAGFMEKESQRVYRQLKGEAFDSFGIKDFERSIQQSEIPLGLMAKYTQALNSQNQEESQKIKNQIVDYMNAQTGIEKSELQKLDAISMLEYIREEGVIYNHSNENIARLMNIVGGIITTALSISLAVTTTNHEWLHQDGLFPYWIMRSAASFLGIYLVLGKTPWVHYMRTYDKIKFYLKARQELKAGTLYSKGNQVDPSEKKSRKESMRSEARGVQIRCDQIFAR